MSFPLIPLNMTTSPVPAKSASEVLNNTLTPDLVRKPLSASDQLVAAEQKEALKKIEKEKRKLQLMAVVGMLAGAAIAIYKRQAIVSGFQKVFSAKQPLKPVVPAPVLTTVQNQKPLASSPFVAETVKTAK